MIKDKKSLKVLKHLQDVNSSKQQQQQVQQQQQL
jgi:hypothetical protein